MIEYHYNDQEKKEEEEGDEWEDGLTIDFSEDDSLDAEEKQTDNIPTLPAPIYPTLESKQTLKKKFGENKKILTKDQIIDLYCPPDVHL